MKKRRMLALVSSLAVLSTVLLTGCHLEKDPSENKGAALKQSVTSAITAQEVQTEQNSASEKKVTVQYIGVEKAKEIALNKAGVKAADAKFVKAEFDIDDGVAGYEVEFYANGTEYEADVNALDGSIIKFEKEAEAKPAASTPTASSKPKEQPKPEQKSTASDYITAAKAKEIALNKADIKAADARALEAEFDKDDGVAVYEVEFKSGKYEYSVEINAKTGKVLNYDREFDD